MPQPEPHLDCFMEELRNFDLSPVTRRLLRKGIVDAGAAEEEFRRLATLWYLHPEKSLTPSQKVDLFWHELIVDTLRYEAFCTSVIGYYVHHVPCDEDTEPVASFDETLTVYRNHFGSPNPAIWGNVDVDAAMCGRPHHHDHRAAAAMCGNPGPNRP